MYNDLEAAVLQEGLGVEGKVPAQHHLSLSDGLSGPHSCPELGIQGILMLPMAN